MLLKAVPESEEIAVDRPLGRVDRSASSPVLNPFDARALAVALALRRPGERITALSMGPPAAATILQDARAAGVDRAVLVSDPALAGSDAQVTATVLARALRPFRAGLVLAGDRTTDGETGQVALEVAGHLGWAAVPSVRRIERALDVDRLESWVDTDEGWARRVDPLPCVVTTGEKVAKPVRLSEEARASARREPVERWTIPDLGLEEREVGAEGSPTVVVELRSPVRDRPGRRFDEGPLSERIRLALAAPMEPAGPARPDPAPVAQARRAGPAGTSAWVFVGTAAGGIDAGAVGILSEVRRSCPEMRAVAVVVGARPPDPEIQRLARAGAESVRWLEADPVPIEPGPLAEALRAATTSAPPPECALLPSTRFGREVAARWAVRASAGLVADVTSFERTVDGVLEWGKPAFHGSYVARIRARGPLVLATVPPGLFAAEESGPGAAIPVDRGPSVVGYGARTSVRERGRELREEFGDLRTARTLVTVGMGVGGPEGIAGLLPWVRRWGAGLGATRRVVDAGWMPAQYQVGLTGHSLAPELAILLGVGKGANHVIGLRRAGRIVAINRDPEAPVFRFVDAGVVADWRESLPFLDRALATGGPGAAR